MTRENFDHWGTNDVYIRHYLRKTCCSRDEVFLRNRVPETNDVYIRHVSFAPGTGGETHKLAMGTRKYEKYRF